MRKSAANTSVSLFGYFSFFDYFLFLDKKIEKQLMACRKMHSYVQEVEYYLNKFINSHNFNFSLSLCHHLPVIMFAMIILVKPPEGIEKRKEHRYMRGRDAQQYITNTKKMRANCGPSLSPFMPKSCKKILSVRVQHKVV